MAQGRGWKDHHTRKRWRILNPPDEKGNYTCWLCLKYVHSSEVTLDHIVPYADDKTFRHKVDNLQPAHDKCNQARGRVLHQLRTDPNYASQLATQKDPATVTKIQRYLHGVRFTPSQGEE